MLVTPHSDHGVKTLFLDQEPNWLDPEFDANEADLLESALFNAGANNSTA